MPNTFGSVKGERFFQLSITSSQLKGIFVTKKTYTVDDVKLQGIAIDQGLFKNRLFLSTKHTGTWLSVQSTMIIGTVPVAT